MDMLMHGISFFFFLTWIFALFEVIHFLQPHHFVSCSCCNFIRNEDECSSCRHV